MCHGKHSSPELIVYIIACLAEGLGIRGTARVFGIDANTVLQWLQEAGEQLSQSPRWMWTARDAESKLLLSTQAGPRTLPMVQAMLHQIVQLLVPGCVPLFLSDDHPNYLPAIVTHFGHRVQPPRRQARGPAPKPRWMPVSDLLYARVVKVLRRRRIVEVQHQVVLGTQLAVDQVLSASGWQINTSFVERLNLIFRQRVAPMRRRSATSCKGQAGLDHQLALFLVNYNFVLPHASLHQALAEPSPRRERGRPSGGGRARQRWRRA
jgi:hypothetical protein